MYKNQNVAAMFSQQKRMQGTHFLSGDAEEDKVIYENKSTATILFKTREMKDWQN